MFGLIFTLAFLCLVFLAAFVGFMKGRKYIWQFSASKLILLVASTAVSTVLSAVAAYFLGGLVTGFVSSLLANENESASILESIPVGTAALTALIAVLLVPIIFYVIFLIVKAIFSCFTARLGRALANTEKPEADGEKTKRKKTDVAKEFASDKKFDAAGAVCGAVCGLLLCVVLLAPVSALLDTANGVVQLAAGGTPVCEIVEEASDNVGINAVDILGAGLVRKGMSTYPINGRLVSVDGEVEFLASAGKALATMNAEAPDEQDTEEIFDEFDESLNNANVIPMLLSELLSAVSEEWSQGEDFYGIDCPSLGEDLDVIVRDFAALMKDSSYDTIKDDISTIFDMIEILAEHDGFNTLEKENGVLELFDNEEMTSELMLSMLENDRLSPLVCSFTNMGISMFTDALALESDYDEMYEDFMNDMSSAYKKAMAKDSGTNAAIHNLAKPVKNVYVEYGIDVTDAMSLCVAADMVEGLSSGDSEEMKSFFAHDSAQIDVAWNNVITVEYLSASSNNSSKVHANNIIGHITDKIAANTSAEIVKNIVKDEFSKSVSGLSEDELDAIAVEIAEMLCKELAEDKVHLENLLFDGANEMHERSVLVTTADINISGKFNGDKAQEAKAIAHAFAVAIDMADEMAEEDAKIDSMLESVGMVFDAFSECEIIGKEKTTDLVTAFFQSETVSSQIGFTTLQATDVADSINEANDGDDSYTSLLKSIGQTTNIMSGSGEDTSAEISKLMKDMTPASSKVLQDITTAETVKNFGASDESAAPVADMFSDMLNNMSEVKKEGMSDEEYEQEAKAVNDMMSIAMNAGSSDSETVFGDGSKTGVSASDFVDRAIDSDVVSKALVDAVYSGGDAPITDPLNLGDSLSESDIVEVEAALDEKWQEVAASGDAAEMAEFRKKITSIASLFNMQVSFTSGGVSIS